MRLHDREAPMPSTKRCPRQDGTQPVTQGSARGSQGSNDSPRHDRHRGSRRLCAHSDNRCCDCAILRSRIDPAVDPRNANDIEHFEAAIARHRLDLQTQLKRSTALPSAMFDQSDAMLEAKLCAATEGIFQKLLEWDAPRALPTDGEQRLEKVGKHELAGLLIAALHGDFARGEMPKLEEFAAAEFAAILAEAAARSVGAPQERALSLLKAQAARDAATLDEAALDISTGLAALLRGGSGERLDGDGDAMSEQESALRQLCDRIADAAARSVDDAANGAPSHSQTEARNDAEEDCA